MKKLIFINRYFFPDHSATSQMLSDLAFHLPYVGHEVHIICSRQLYESPDAKLAAFEQMRGVKIHRVWTSSFGRSNLIGRAFDYLSFYFSASLKLLYLADAHTVVVAKTDPPLISIPVSWVTRLRGAHLVNWVQDVFPEVAVAYGIKVLGGRLGSIFRWLRNNSSRNASMNVVLGQRMAEHLIATGVVAEKVRVIANWVDGNAITPIQAESNSLREAWGLSNNFVVMYSGNMGRGHEFNTILRAAALLQSEARIVFLFVGGGNQRSLLANEAKRLALTNVLFKPYQPREQLGLSLTVGDAHLISMLPEMEGLIFPSKLYGVLAAGRPVVFVGAKNGEIAQQLVQADCGVGVEQGDAQGLVSALVKMAESPVYCKRLGSNGRRLLDEHLSQKQAFELWENVLVNAG